MMSEFISHPLELNIEEFEMIQEAFSIVEKQLKANIKKCQASYTGKVTTEQKIKEYKIKIDEMNELLSKIGQEFS